MMLRNGKNTLSGLYVITVTWNLYDEDTEIFSYPIEVIEIDHHIRALSEDEICDWLTDNYGNFVECWMFGLDES